MRVKLTTPLAEIDKCLNDQIQLLDKEILEGLCYAAEESIIAGRLNGSYKDQTGNLRSSVGYIVAKDGRVYRSGGFEQQGSGSEGVKEGLALAKRVVASYPKGYVLVVVAGMQYASYVAAKGFDVLDSAEQTARDIVPVILNQFRSLREDF